MNIVPLNARARGSRALYNSSQLGRSPSKPGKPIARLSVASSAASALDEDGAWPATLNSAQYLLTNIRR